VVVGEDLVLLAERRRDMHDASAVRSGHVVGMQHLVRARLAHEVVERRRVPKADQLAARASPHDPLSGVLAELALIRREPRLGEEVRLRTPGHGRLDRQIIDVVVHRYRQVRRQRPRRRRPDQRKLAGLQPAAHGHRRIAASLIDVFVHPQLVRRQRGLVIPAVRQATEALIDRTGDTGGVGRTRWEIHVHSAAPPGQPSPPTIATAAAAAGRPGSAAGPGAPPFAYYGGKTRLAARIAALFPDHGHYVEPFAGSLAVLLAKPPAGKETVNDLDQELVGFWRTLRDRPEQLIRACALTPHSRAEHAAAHQSVPGTDAPDRDEVERARRVWVRLTQGRSGAMAPTGWKRFLDPHGPRLSMPGYLAGYAARMPDDAERLAAVSLECRPALEVIADYGTHPDTLLYVDPPYLAVPGSYRHRMPDDAALRELADALHGCRAAVVLSGYPSPLYERLYAGWHHTTLTATTHRGSRGPPSAPKSCGPTAPRPPTTPWPRAGPPHDLSTRDTSPPGPHAMPAGAESRNRRP
jgi:DNA adenine methylase